MKNTAYIFFFFLGGVINAQDIKNIPATPLYKGFVKDKETGEPIIGASVIIKGTKIGVAADFDGKFELQLKQGDTIEVYAIGYQKKKLLLKPSVINEILLELSTTLLNEVELVAVGYGVLERRDLTGSVTSVKSEEIEKTSISFDNSIAGKVSGLRIVNSNGAPGSASAITLRGVSTLAGDSSPLIVIDGVPIYGTGKKDNTFSYDPSSIPASGMGGNTVNANFQKQNEFESNPLASLNPNDIESIEVLKDAYATAIYGSRGATGVILVTTKKGKRDIPKVSLDISTSISNPIGTIKTLNTDEYVDFYNEYYKNSTTPLVKKENTNWQEAVMVSAIGLNTNLSVSGSQGKIHYFLSALQTKQQAYIINNNYDKITIRLNLDYKGKKTRFGMNLNYTVIDNAALNADEIYRNAILKSPNLPIYTNENYEYEDIYNFGTELINPVADAKRNIKFLKENRIVGNFYVEYKPFPGVNLKSEIGTDLFNTNAYNRIKNILSAKNTDQILRKGTANQSLNQRQKLVLNNTFLFKKRFGKHSFNAVLGQSFETSLETRTSMAAHEFYSDEILSISSAGSISVREAFTQKSALTSYFTRINYAFDNKYLLGFTYRIDGSSRFSRNNRYVGFPAFSGGWRLSKESFVEPIQIINDLKIRASLGYSGIDGTAGYYGNQGQYTIKNTPSYNGNPYLHAKQPNNPNLEWEKTISIDVGLDATLFKNKVNFTLDYYHKKITNMLYDSALPLYMGFSSQKQNIGNMRNQGVEFALSTENIKTNYFVWESTFNISRNTNTLLKLNDSGLDNERASSARFGYKFFKEGHSVNEFFLYEWGGVDSQTGDPIWVYADGSKGNEHPEKKFGAEAYKHRKTFGKSTPDFYGGISNNFTYKKFELSVFVNFSYGAKIYNGTKATLMTYTHAGRNNLSKEILKKWITDGHKTNIPRIRNNSISDHDNGVVDYTVGRNSSRFLENASYIRLKNIRLSYNFDKEKLKKIYLNQLKIYIATDNVLTLTPYTGVDPEVSAFGSDALLLGFDELSMPANRTFRLGMKIEF